MPPFRPSLPLLALLAAGLVAGCGRGPSSAPAGATLPAVQGVRSTLTEVAPGRFVIARELLVDSATVVLVARRGGQVERIETAAAFAARLDVPDSLRARVLAHTGPVEARAPDAPGPAWNAPASGMPLGTALFYTMAMNVWRPEAYAAIRAGRAGPPSSEAASPAAGAVERPAGGPATPAPRPRVAPAPARQERVAPPERDGRGKGRDKGRGRGNGRRKGW